MHLAKGLCISSGNCWRQQLASRLALIVLAVSGTGCSEGVKQLTDRVAALTDKHESLYSQMLDCEQRYANLLAKASDLESVQQARPQMIAEAKQYSELGEQFIKTEGLTPEKLVEILKRSLDRQQSINAQIKEQMQRLIGDGTNNQMRMAIPHLEWSSAELNFSFDADAVAHGKKPHKEQLADQMEAAKARMQETRENMKSRMEESRNNMKKRMDESRARAEEMRAKFRRPPVGSGSQSTP
jgi:hypothetical protein